MYDEVRLKEQKNAVNAWIAKGGVGSIVGSPGVGKTIIGLLASFVQHRANPNSTTVVVTNSKAIAEQWRRADPNMNRITHFMTIDQVINRLRLHDELLENTKIDLIIYDEYHTMLGNVTFECINRIKAKHKLGLFGVTPKGDSLQKINMSLPIVHEITVEDAVFNEWVLAVEEVNIYCPYTDAEANQYIDLCEGMDKISKSFDDVYKRLRDNYRSRYDLMKGCIEDTYVDKLSNNEFVRSVTKPFDTIRNIQRAIGYNPKLVNPSRSQLEFNSYWEAEAIIKRVHTYNKLTRIRTAMLPKLTSKLDIAVDLITTVYPNQIIVYCESIDTCNELYDALRENPDTQSICKIHSKMGSIPMLDSNGKPCFFKTGKPMVVSAEKQKVDIISRFASGEVSVLLLVNSLNEGLNIPNLSFVMNLSGSRDNVKYSQRISRANRVSDDKKDPIAINLVCDTLTIFNDAPIEPVVEGFDIHASDIVPAKPDITFQNVDEEKLLKRQEGRFVVSYSINELNTLKEWMMK